MADIKYVEDRAAMKRYTSWHGDIGYSMDRRLEHVQRKAKLTVGVSRPNPLNPRPGGTLRESIVIRKDPPTSQNLTGHVGSWTVKYAKLHHTGTKPHIIRPKRAKKLRFWVWSPKPGIVFAKLVRHPGTKPNHYLTKWLREVV